MFADGERTSASEHSSSEGVPRLPYSAIGIELRSGKFRVKDDSRANYADIIEVDHDAQVMVVGSVARYFDRVRRNVNKAYMRHILKRALQKYRDEKGKGSQSTTSLQASTSASGSTGADDDAGSRDETEEERMMEDIVARAVRGKAKEQPLMRDDERRRKKTYSEAATLELPPTDRRLGQVAREGSEYDLRSLHSVARKSVHNVAMAGMK